MGTARKSDGLRRKRLRWWVYIVQCKDRSLYTGITNDVARRMTAHNEARGARYTRQRRPVTLLYCEAARGKSSAAKREAAIKKWTRTEKIRFIQGVNAAASLSLA